MYKLTLILKYLRKRRIAWVSLIAVMLCTAMVLIVISVMGGWLTMFKAKFRGMSGDIVITRKGLAGFSGYEQMLSQIKKLPQVDQALPLIHTLGLINIDNQIIDGVEVTGLDIAEFSHFNNFRESLLRQYQLPIKDGKTPPPVASFGLLPDVNYKERRPNDPRAADRPGIIVGGPLVGITKDKNNQLVVPSFLFDGVWCRLEVVPVASDLMSLKDVTPVANIYWIVDASRTQLFQIDEHAAYVPFDVLQKDMRMDAQNYTEMVDGKSVPRVQPARCSEIQVNLKAGANREEMLEKINDIVQTISMKLEPAAAYPVMAIPWEKQDQVAGFLGAVENEKSLVTFLFGIISIVAIFLVFCILYMIVVEKTKDIGIIKSVGATSQGVAVIFLGYGLAIGIVGGGFGLAIATLIVTYINEIHTELGRLFGIVIWKPEVYAFDKIPDHVDPLTAAIVVAVAILSAVLGAVVPAIRAARSNPVESLRFE